MRWRAVLEDSVEVSSRSNFEGIQHPFRPPRRANFSLHCCFYTIPCLISVGMTHRSLDPFMYEKGTFFYHRSPDGVNTDLVTFKYLRQGVPSIIYSTVRNRRCKSTRKNLCISYALWYAQLRQLSTASSNRHHDCREGPRNGLLSRT